MEPGPRRRCLRGRYLSTGTFAGFYVEDRTTRAEHDLRGMVRCRTAQRAHLRASADDRFSPRP